MINSMGDFGKPFIVAGIILILAGLFISFVGRLPGDIYIKRENFTFYFPITSSILFSILLSLIFYLFSRFFR